MRSLFNWLSVIPSELWCLVRGFRNDGMEDCYSILIRFDEQKAADTFYKHFNGRRFSSLEVWLLQYLSSALAS